MKKDLIYLVVGKSNNLNLIIHFYYVLINKSNGCQTNIKRKL